MTISLPYLWLLGHAGALLGAVLLLSQVVWRVPIALRLGMLGGALSTLFLAYVLWSIDERFFGVYRWLAWLVAFLAGYGTLAPVGYVTAQFRRTRGRRST